MDGEIQFALYNMPDDSGNVQVVIKDETIIAVGYRVNSLKATRLIDANIRKLN
jgi:hypothetical protein